MPTVASPKLVAAMTQFVDRGGQLVAEALPGEFGPDGRPQPVAPGYGLDQLFGVSEIEPDSDAVAVDLASDGTLVGAWQRATVQVADCEVIGTFRDGTPGVTLRRTPSGSAVHVGTYPSIGYHRAADPSTREAVAESIRADEIVRPLQRASPRPGLLSRRAKSQGGSRIVFALNWTATDAQTATPFQARLIQAGVGDAARAASMPIGAIVNVPAKSGLILLEQEGGSDRVLACAGMSTGLQSLAGPGR
jgi:beta-galactosidase